VLLPACGDAPDTPHATVTLSGTAFNFVNSAEPVVGARVWIAEYPDLETTTDGSGHYALRVPDQASITPVIEAGGSFMKMYIQTFHTEGADITDVKLQVIDEVVYILFSAALGIDPDPDFCQISSTVNEAAIQGMTLTEMKAHGAHGVAGAIVASAPAIAPEHGPVYFDEATWPDATLTETTVDGGVVWSNVPPGVYRISAAHPDRRFEPFVATCKPGRFINAGPPWGLREVVQ